MLVIASGCASTTKGVWSVNSGNGGGEKKDASIEELLRILDSRYEEISTIKALVSIEVDSIPPVPLRSFDGEVIYSKPRDIRIRGFGPVFPRPIFDFIAKGEDFQFQALNDGKIFEGNLNELLSTGSIEGPIKFSDLLDVLGAVGTPFIDPSLVTALEKTDEYFIIYVIVMHGGKGKLDKKIWIDRVDLQVKKEEVFDLSGLRRMVLSFGDYRPTGEIMRPYKISAEREGLKIILRFREIMMNPQLAPVDFNLKGVNGAQL